ncbi:hypothetical protein MO867_11875 [Microbulbifer sp. OS29]|uniref:Thiaminase-2/PQQC domain-containing protein n=1 Tax=Microbulbifer okhotskensis TaxID=2926617 RepID=A0A9X2ESP5_9GAMM|nr:hypothetical protein [Microbulbifer okhotskensis]MCO1335033.1 hypothetical protein [Microbulbifer okhotskensis]
MVNMQLVGIGFFGLIILLTATQGATADVATNQQAAKTLIQRLEQQYLNNASPAFVQQLEKNTLPDSKLQAFAMEQRLINLSDLRSSALSLHRFGGIPGKNTRAFFIGITIAEIQASKQMPILLQALGISPEQIAQYQPLASAQAYPAYTAWLANYAQPAEIAAALLINFQSFGKNTTRVAKALRQYKKLSNKQLSYLMAFTQLPNGFRQQATEIIAKGLASGIRESDIEIRVRLIQAYEREFWQAFETSENPDQDTN